MTEAVRGGGQGWEVPQRVGRGRPLSGSAFPAAMSDKGGKRTSVWACAVTNLGQVQRQKEAGGIMAWNLIGAFLSKQRARLRKEQLRWERRRAEDTMLSGYEDQIQEQTMRKLGRDAPAAGGRTGGCGGVSGRGGGRFRT